MMRDIFLDIARSGILAPSADNKHVFRFDFNDSCIRLWPTPEFVAETDPLPRVLGLLSMGAVVENMRLRANALGCVANARWFDVGSSGPMVELDVESFPTLPADELASAIATRHTNRRMYHGPGLNAHETHLLNAAVAPIEGTRLIWLQGAARRKALGLIWRAESERFLRRKLHHDIFSSIRFDLSWSETADWALPLGALEVEMPMRPLFKALRHWALMRPLTWMGMHWLLGLRAGWLPAWQAPALGLLVSSLPVDQGAVAVGSALERLWLRATLLDLAMQPMAASAVLMQPSLAKDGASDALRLALASGWQVIAPGVMPLMVFRMGHAALPSVRSTRRPVTQYLSSM
jgi:hypothetical protein